MTHAALVELARDQVERFSAPQPAKPVRDSLSRFFSLQRMRAGSMADRVVARYQRRVKELEPLPHMDTRGLPQAWRRDSRDQACEVD